MVGPIPEVPVRMFPFMGVPTLVWGLPGRGKAKGANPPEVKPARKKKHMRALC